MTTTTCDTARLRELFDRGLARGIGSADGQVCVEGAISLACGLGFSDAPPCVAKPDRAYAIRINDAQWSSPEARANALWPLALAQIGTAGTNRRVWVAKLVELTIRRVVPVALRAEADRHPVETHAAALRAAALRAEADRCELEGTRDAADANTAATATANAAAYAAYAAADAAADNGKRDEVLRLSVQCALDAYDEGRCAMTAARDRGVGARLDALRALLATEDDEDIAYYTCRGSVRGACGVRHRTRETAQACCDRDGRGCRAGHGRAAYSDRYPVAVRR